MAPSTSPRSGGRSLAYVVTFFLVALVGVYGWKEFALRQAQVESEAVRREGEAERAALERRLRQSAEARALELVRLFALPLGWAVQADVREGRIAGVEGRFRELIREPAVRRVALADADGVIRLATDQKLLEQPAAAHFGALAGSGAIAVDGAGGELAVVVPLGQAETPLGRVFVVFTRELLLPPLEAQPPGGPPATRPAP